MTRRLHVKSAVVGVSLALCVAMAVLSALLSAQGGGRPPGGGGGGSMGMSQTRSAMLTTTLKLDDAQKKQAKTILNDAFKGAAPLRTSLTAARQTLGAAVQAGDQAQIDQAVSAYAERATAMATAEAQAIAKILRALTPDQQANAAAVQTTASLMRGAFIGKKWDTTPDVRFY